MASIFTAGSHIRRSRPSAPVSASCNDLKGPVFILGASPSEGRALATPLRDARLECVVCNDPGAFLESARGRAEGLVVQGAAVLGLDPEGMHGVLSTAEGRANLPIVIVVQPDRFTHRSLYHLPPLASVPEAMITILQAPLHDVTFVSVITNALRVREQQCAQRDWVQDVEEAASELRSAHADLQQAHSDLQAVHAALEEKHAALKMQQASTQKQLSARTHQVRQLTLALSDAEQQERARISEVLHDHLQQLVHGAKIWAESLERHSLSGEDAETAKARIVSLLDEAVHTTRSLASTLNPTVLYSEGLLAAFEWLVVHFARVHALTVHCDVRAVPPIESESLRTLLFTLARELLFNVVKHAATDTATLRAGMEDEHLVIVVEDEGAGFDAEAAMSATDATTEQGMGLQGMRERLRQLGGTLEVDAAPGAGTRAQLRLPVSALPEATP